MQQQVQGGVTQVLPSVATLTGTFRLSFDKLQDKILNLTLFWLNSRSNKSSRRPGSTFDSSRSWWKCEHNTPTATANRESCYCFATNSKYVGYCTACATGPSPSTTTAAGNLKKIKKNEIAFN